MTVSNETAVKEVKASEKALKNRVAILELKMRAVNLKFRGLPEHSEINENLMAFMTSWITSFIQPAGGVFPIIMAVYRLGAASQAKPNFPRDVLVQFQSLKDKDAVLSATRQQAVLKYKEFKYWHC